MEYQPVEQEVKQRQRTRSIGRDLLLALAVAAVLSLCWAVRDWANLSHLLLPDSDDMMRLAQVRDWLGGQGINDWTQYRMAPPFGAPMHWSRVNDFGIAGLILAFTPLLGRHGAELAAVLGYPALLFSAHLFLSARLARRIWGAEAALIAVVLGAVAYPGTTVFAAGRIDHHALQVVLTEVAVLATVARAGLASGAVAGIAIALGLVVGLETVPQVAAIIAVIFAFWVVRGRIESARLAGVALGLAATTVPFVMLLRPTLWSASLCDAFTPATSNATFAGAGAMATLALLTPRLGNWRMRLAVGAALGSITLAVVLRAYPACLAGPYGAVDPFLRREFIPHIDEANSVFAQPSMARMVQLGGLMLAACAGVVWTALRYPARWRRWAALAAVVGISGLVTLAQVRGTYVGAPLSAALLSGVVLAARHRVPNNAALLAGAWLGCAGMGWYAAPILAEKLLPRTVGPASGGAAPTLPRTRCNTAEGWESVNSYAPGVVMTSTSIAADLTAATGMSTVGAGYHRNNRGNMDLYRYFLSPPTRGAVIARAWHVRYVAYCPGDFEEMNASARFPRSLVAILARGHAPAGFEQLPLRGTRLRFYRIAP